MIDPAVRETFSALVAAAFADGVLAEEERLILRRKAAEMGVSERDMADLIAQAQKGRLSVAIPASDRGREELLDALIEIVTADGRVEASEHHFLAKYASALKLSLPDLRQRIKARMGQRGTRVTQAAPSPRPAPAPFAAAALPPLPPFPPAPSIPLPGPVRTELGPTPPRVGPIQLDAPRLVDPCVADLPPVTLQLIRQTISCETDEVACRYIERMLGVTAERAQGVLKAVLEAFPDLRRPSEPSAGRVRRSR